MNLYPLIFKPILKQKIWGSESWQLSATGQAVSIVQNGYLKDNDLNELIEVYMGELVGDHVFEQYGNQFPLLFKFIETHDNLSVQVHPDDETAAQRHDSLGKDEMWYVMHCKPKAQLILGLTEDTTPEHIREYMAQKRLNTLLNKVEVKAGDAAFIPAGLVHALREEVFVAEIQQASDITYRLHDYDRIGADGKPRELHIEQALSVMKMSKHNNPLINYDATPNQVQNIVSCDHFTTNLIIFDRTIGRDYAPLDSFVVYMCVEGKMQLQTEEGAFNLNAGQTILLPASTEEVRLIPNPTCRILETYIP